jgi:SAM-dependent methyltransferase
MSSSSSTPVADRSNLLREQYKDGSNLSARIRLHGRFSTNRYGMFRWIFDKFAFPENARVLELGSGTAMLWTGNRDRIPAGWKITLSDFSLGMLGDVRRNIAAIARAFNLMQLDAQAIPFADHSFDAVIANHMLYHVPDVPRALREIRRVLIPGGRCYAATFSRIDMRELRELIRRFVGIDSKNRAALHFGLENGYDMMRDCFASVDLSRYPDSLVITEGKPLMDYVNSMSMRWRASDEQMAAMQSFVEAELSTRGSIKMTKDAGILIGVA